MGGWVSTPDLAGQNIISSKLLKYYYIRKESCKQGVDLLFISIYDNFVRDLDNELSLSHKQLTGSDLFNCKREFGKAIKKLSGSEANFSGLTEFIIFRTVYHALGFEADLNGNSASYGNITLSSGKSYIGKRGNTQSPDITIELDSVLRACISVKATIPSTAAPQPHEYNSPVVRHFYPYLEPQKRISTYVQDVSRIENLHNELNTAFRSTTIIFSKVKDPYMDRIIDQYKWHSYIILEGNSSVFVDELFDKLNIRDLTKQVGRSSDI